MGDFDHLRRAEDAVFRFVLLSIFVFMPLAFWKTIEIIIWLCSHVSINWN